jgi:hypothetical protein
MVSEVIFHTSEGQMMLRRSLVALALTGLIFATAIAETYGEKVVSVDVDKKTITIPVEKKDKAFKVDGSATFQTQRKAGKRLAIAPLKDGIKGIKAKDEVVITTERKDGEEVITKVVVVVSDPKAK